MAVATDVAADREWYNNTHFWVLEHIVEWDDLHDDHITALQAAVCSAEDLPDILQARLLLRALRLDPVTIEPHKLSALYVLNKISSATPVTSRQRLETLIVPTELDLMVRTELVLAELLAHGQELAQAHTQAEVMKKLEDFFPASHCTADSPMLRRREELLQAMQEPAMLAQVERKYPTEVAVAALQEYVAQAHEGLGPTIIEMIEADARSGNYEMFGDGYGGDVWPRYQQQQMADRVSPAKYRKLSSSKRQPSGRTANGGADVMEDLNNQRSNLQRAVGSRPLQQVLAAAALAQAQYGPGEAGHSQRPITSRAAAGVPKTRTWDATPEGTPQRERRHISRPSGGVAPLPAGSPTMPNNQKERRRIGKWTEAETSALVQLVQEHGKGRWKEILSAGQREGHFRERSQVDLKDKWRNIEKQLAPSLLPAMEGAFMQPTATAEGAAAEPAAPQGDPNASGDAQQ